MSTIQNQQFGVEVEVAGVARNILATAVEQSTGGTITATNSQRYNATIITDTNGREWKVQNDSSIEYLNGTAGSEIVSPILTYQDIPLLQNVIRSLRNAGAKTPPSTSCHIHVSAQPHSPQSLSRLAKMVYKNEQIIFDALKVRRERRQRYCKPMDYNFVLRVNSRRPQSDQQLNECWFGVFTPHPQHYHSSRYFGLNYVNRWRELGTIEFRYYAQESFMYSSHC